MLPSKEKRPNNFCAPKRIPVGEGEQSRGVFAHQPLRSLTLVARPGLNPSAPAKLSPPDLELCRGADGAPHSCKRPSAPMGSAVPVGWCRGCSALGIKGHGCCVWVRLPQPGDPAANLFVSFLYRILLPKKENEVG